MRKHRIFEIPQNFATSQVDIPLLRKCEMFKNKKMQFLSLKHFNSAIYCIHQNLQESVPS
jgi:hypothetical protein